MKRAKTSILLLVTMFLISVFHLTVSGQTPGTTQKAVPFDKFKALKSEDEKTRLDYFSSELQRDSTLTGYIVVFGKRGGPASEAKKRAENAKNYLLTKLPKGNPLVTIDYCTRPAVEYELWIVPKGKKPPFFCAKPR